MSIIHWVLFGKLLFSGVYYYKCVNGKCDINVQRLGNEVIVMIILWNDCIVIHLLMSNLILILLAISEISGITKSFFVNDWVFHMVSEWDDFGKIHNIRLTLCVPYFSTETSKCINNFHHSSIRIWHMYLKIFLRWPLLSSWINFDSSMDR